MTVRVLIPATYPEVDFAFQRENLERAHVEIETQPDGARMLTFPDGWLPIVRYPRFDWVVAPTEIAERNGHAVPARFSFDKGWLQS